MKKHEEYFFYGLIVGLALGMLLGGLIAIAGFMFGWFNCYCWLYGGRCLNETLGVTKTAGN